MPDAPARPLRLRLYWDSGGDPIRWRGEARLSSGVLSDVQPWGGDPDAASIATINSGRVRIAPRLPRRIAAFDVTTQADRDAMLHVELTPGDGAPVFVELPLAELVGQPRKVSIGKAGALQIFRAVDDRLRIETDHQSLLFAPGGTFDFSLHAEPMGVAEGTPLDVQVEVYRGRAGEQLPGVQSQRVTLGATHAASADFSVPLPQQEGVYTLRMSARKPAGLMRGWTRSGNRPLLQRSVQVMVWDQSQATELDDSRRLVVEIDPTNSHWWRLMPEWKWMRKVPLLPQGPLGRDATEVVERADGKLVRLPPAETRADAPWQAYPLPIEKPGAPHILEIETPDDLQQQLVLTLFDRDALGRASSLGDSMVALTGDNGLQPPQGRTTVRRLFWPKTDSPMLVLSNRSQKSMAQYGRLRVYSLDRRPASPIAPTPTQRTQAFGFTKLDLPAVMQATHQVSPDTRYTVEDLQTYYQTAQRLADYVQLAGYNGAVVTVASDQGSIYPTAVLGKQTGPQRGALASGMGDIPRKDLLELLLREFDRRGLCLAPLLKLEGAIAQVEAARHAPQPPVVDCLGPGGQPNKADRVRYNPLSPPFRGAATAAVAELVGRYSHHASFAGVGLELSADSHLVLPADDYAADPVTFDRFLQASGLAWPDGVPRDADQVRRAIAGPWNDAWRRWRAEETTRLFAEMVHAIRADRADAKLMLLPNRLFDDAAGREALRPRLGSDPQIDSLMAARGVSRSLLASVPGVALLAPGAIAGAAMPNSEAAYLQFCQQWEHDPHRQRGSALWSDAQQSSLLGFKARSPFGAQQTFTATKLAVRALGVQGPRALVTAAAQAPGDVMVEASNAAPLELDQAAIALRRTLRQATVDAPPVSVAAPQPLVLQQYAAEDGSTILAGNPSPWPLRATLTLQAPRPCHASYSGEQRTVSLAAGRQTAPLELPPYSLSVVRLDQPGVVVVQANLQPLEDASQQLVRQVDLLSRRDLNARRRFEGCKNLSFEQLDAQGLPANWNWANDPQVGRVSVNRQDPADGQAAAEIIAGATPMNLTSESFAPPETRQLAIAFCLRTQRSSDDSSLAIHFEGDGGYDAYTTIDAKTLAASDNWRQFVFADNLPLKMSGQMRIRLEARNVSVAVDNLELDSLTFPLDFALPAVSAQQRLALVKLQQSASVALAEGRVADCQQILESHWARFLGEFTPLLAPQRNVADSPAENPPAEADADEPAPSVSNRWKSYLPGFLRF